MRGTGTQKRSWLKWMAPLLAGAIAVPCLAAESGPKHPVNPLADSERSLLQGRVDEAIAKLRGVVAANPKDGQAHLLLCRAFYSEENADAAVGECEAALTTLGSDSMAQDWMGRAYGLKADRSGPLQGYKLASKVRTAFETAVQLNPKNPAAVDDLSEYYVGAPSILGGGTDRAKSLANRVEADLPEQAHRIRGLAAEKEHDFGTAEREFRAAASVNNRPDAWTDLGHFYFRRDDKDKSIDALRHAVDVNKTHDASLVDVASILIKMKREPQMALRALTDYLASNAKSDDAPAFKAYVELGKLKESQGDKQGAETAFQQALALAKDYAPAKRALQHI